MEGMEYVRVEKGTAWSLLSPRQLRCNTFGRERLNHVARFNVVEVGERDTAFEPVLDLGRVVLEALELLYAAGVNGVAVSKEPHAAVAPNRSVCYEATRHRTHLADTERLADFRMALEGLFVNRIEKTGHRELDIVDQLINDAVLTYV